MVGFGPKEPYPAIVVDVSREAVMARKPTLMTQAREALDLAEMCLNGGELTNVRIALKAAHAWLADERHQAAAEAREVGQTFERLQRRHDRLQAQLLAALS